ncbi:all-trans-phytoene synthase [bacterium BMS3Bbin03]|nr:all-trans-phytoene synthase [bacterium BMS3Bbin03]
MPKIETNVTSKMPVSLAQAEEFTRNLARSHYENFTVGTFLLPREKRQHIYNIYAFARIGDDLADEIAGHTESLSALKAYEDRLQACCDGHPESAVFTALYNTIQTFDIPIDPFQRLLKAFRQDRLKNRYETFDEVLDYCQNSANPVGELFLTIFDYRDRALLPFSDAVCTALQLTNFWQDVSRDALKNRIYIPQEDLRRFQVTEEEIFSEHFSGKFRKLIRFEVTRTRERFDAGKKLFQYLKKDISLDVRLFVSGGEAILDKIEKQNYDVLSGRPSLSKWDRARLFLRAWWIVRKGKNGGQS